MQEISYIGLDISTSIIGVCFLDVQGNLVKLDNINVVICNSSIFHLLGTKIDWKKNIMGEAFHFENPNASSKCGCGTSFGI